MPEHLREIHIKTCPKNEMSNAYGDYWIDNNGVLQIRVAESDIRTELILAMHELWEPNKAMLDGISIEQIDKWIADNPEIIKNDPNPGAHETAPHKLQHIQATAFEVLAVTFLGMNWIKYDQELDALYQEDA